MLELPYEVSASEVDSEYHHVHHAHTIKILEWVRLELLKKIGFPPAQFIAAGLFPVVTGVRVQYRREVVLGPITVTCDSWTLADKEFTMSQRILNQKGKVAVIAEVDWLFMGGVSRRAESPPEAFLEAMRGWPPS